MNLIGALNATRVAELWSDREKLFQEHEINLQGMTTIDSAGIAFLVKWSQACNASSQRLSIVGGSKGLQQLIELYGVTPLFDLITK